MVITEARESGRSGIADATGHMRPDVLSAVLKAIDPAVVMFEAPTKDLQVEMIRAVGPAVNLGNVAASDVIGVQTLRRGLRGDTLLDLTTGGAGSPLRSRRPVQPVRPVQAAGSTPSAA
jgi:phosphosulfolactate synthase